MTELIQNVPAGITAFYCKGPMLETDLQQTVWPAINDQLRITPDINCLIVLVTPEQDLVSLITWLEFMSSIQTQPYCKRIALLADSARLDKANAVFENEINKKYKGFFLQQFPDAIFWLQGATLKVSSINSIVSPLK